MVELAAYLDQVYLGNSVVDWIRSIILLLVLLAGATVVKWLSASRLKSWSEKTITSWDDAVVDLIRSLRVWLLAPLLIRMAMSDLTLAASVDNGLHIVSVACVAIQLLLLSRVLIDAGISALERKSRDADGQPDPSVVSSMGMLRFFGLLIAGSIVLMLALSNLGVEITPMLTGLGIGGIAVALAVQNILGDLFASLTILLDRPFVVGDFIIVGDDMGSVERIGIKTTRVRSLSGEQLIFANGDLLTSRVQNFKRMQERRILFTVGVTYETPPDRLYRLPEIISAAVLRQDQTRLDRCHFKGFGAYSLDFEVVYYVLTPEYNRYMDIQQAINFELIRVLAEEGIEFAYPTQVEIRRLGGRNTAARTATPAPVDRQREAISSREGSLRHLS